MLCGSLDGDRVWGRMDPCICMAESLHCLPEIITTLLIDYIPIQDKKLKKKQLDFLFKGVEAEMLQIWGSQVQLGERGT